ETDVCDLEGALKRLGGDRSILMDLAKMFCEDSPALIESTAAGIGADRFTDAGRAAHNLRGLASNFGAVRLIARLKELEASLGQNNREKSLILVAPVREERRRLEDALKAFCQESFSPARQ